MIETRFTWRWLLVIAVLGIVVGNLIGLAIGWLVAPNIGSSTLAGLSVSAQNDYIILVANTYVYDQDLVRAKQRLAQLQDPKIVARVERLAKALAARQDIAAANVADLAVALGSEDSSLQVMAASAGVDGHGLSDAPAPTKVARAETSGQDASATDRATAEPTVGADRRSAHTPKPTADRRPDAPTPTRDSMGNMRVGASPPTAEPTAVPATRPPRPTAQPTAPPTSAPALMPSFYPAFPDGWYSQSRTFIPAQVAPGQTYWRLKEAIFCDVPDPGHEHEDTCPRPGMPGGENDHTIYVTVLDENGGCADAVVKSTLNTGETVDLERKPVPFPYTSCAEHFEKVMFGEGNTIWVDGLPSDRLGELVMNSPKLNWSSHKAHVRYILIFQRTTR